jgi:hypothetical protein
VYLDLLTCYRCQQAYTSSMELLDIQYHIYLHILVRILKQNLGDYQFIIGSPMYYYSFSSAVNVVTLLIFQHLELAV